MIEWYDNSSDPKREKNYHEDFVGHPEAWSESLVGIGGQRLVRGGGVGPNRGMGARPRLGRLLKSDVI